MASIVLLDDTFGYSGDTLRTKPLGGLQAATVMLAEAFARRGHQVTVSNRITVERVDAGVTYLPLEQAQGLSFDVAIADCAPKFFNLVKAKSKILWLHGTAGYLRKFRHYRRLLMHWPHAVVTGDYHHSTWNKFYPVKSLTVIPHGIEHPFLSAAERLPPKPRAIFTSNPRRGLEWLLGVWRDEIFPKIPNATLELFSGSSTYAGIDDANIRRALATAAAFQPYGVILRDPVSRWQLAKEFETARVMLYPGDKGETFCFAAAEAQASGVPLVTAGIGCLAERVIDGETGFVAPTPATFGQKAVQLLMDDRLWQTHHRACLQHQRQGTWDYYVPMWEKLF